MAAVIKCDSIIYMFLLFMSCRVDVDMYMDMASLVSAALHHLVLFVLLHPLLAVRSNDFLSPLLSPIFDGVCNEVECGKGKCKPSVNGSFPYECECDSGWTQPLSIDFLPCVIPNCTITSSCLVAAPSPTESQHHHSDGSILDPCSWGNMCGSGKCNRTSSFTYSCACSEGSSNLLNTTIFPCFRPCQLGGDCRNLGILLFNKTAASPPPPAQPDNSKNQASYPYHWNLHLLLILVLSVAFVCLSFGF